MTRTNVNNWYLLDESNKREDQLKWYICSTAEGYINGIVNCGYELMNREEWKQYIVECLNMDINAGMMVNGIEFRHLRYEGNKKLNELIDLFLNEYEDIQEYIIEA